MSKWAAHSSAGVKCRVELFNNLPLPVFFQGEILEPSKHFLCQASRQSDFTLWIEGSLYRVGTQKFAHRKWNNILNVLHWPMQPNIPFPEQHSASQHGTSSVWQKLVKFNSSSVWLKNCSGERQPRSLRPLMLSTQLALRSLIRFRLFHFARPFQYERNPLSKNRARQHK